MVTKEDLAQAILELKNSNINFREEMKNSNYELKKLQAETEKHIKAVSQNISGVNKSIGQETEEFFFSSMTKNPSLANTNFDYVYKNDTRNLKGKTQEIDILLENGNSIGIVEVKNKVTQKSIDQLDKIIDDFYYFHQEYEDYKLIGALAGKIFPKHLQTIALKKGYSVLTQQGDHIEQINPA